MTDRSVNVVLDFEMPSVQTYPFLFTFSSSTRAYQLPRVRGHKNEKLHDVRGGGFQNVELELKLKVFSQRIWIGYNFDLI